MSSSPWIGCPGTSVSNYLPTLHNIPEEQISHLHSGGSLKSRISTLHLHYKTKWLMLFTEIEMFVLRITKCEQNGGFSLNAGGLYSHYCVKILSK
jgi:hypothetical protein